MPSDKPVIDWFSTYFQEAPEAKAALAFIRTLTPRFAPISGELADSEWTAFKYLTQKRVIEGVLRLSFTDPTGRRRVEHYLVAGEYVAAMPSDYRISRDEPLEFDLVQARLLSYGELLKHYLSSEATDAVKARGVVLSLLAEAKEEPGTAQRVIPRAEGPGGLTVGGNPLYASPVLRPTKPTGEPLIQPGKTAPTPPAQNIQSSSRLTLAQIWAANPGLDEAAKDRVRGNLNTAVAKNTALGGTIKPIGKRSENYYDAQLVSRVLAEERKKHGK